MYVMVTKGQYWSEGMEGHVFKVYYKSDEEYCVDPDSYSVIRFVELANGIEIDLPYGVAVDNKTGYLNYAGEDYYLIKRDAIEGDLVLITKFDGDPVAAIREVDSLSSANTGDFYLDEDIDGENYFDNDLDKHYVLVAAGSKHKFEEPAEYEDATPAADLAYEPMDMVPEEAHDFVNHPNHYTTGKFEVIEIIEEITKGYDDPFIGYNIGNVQKYIARAPHKGNLAEDLRKAKKYLEFALNYLESEGE